MNPYAGTRIQAQDFFYFFVRVAIFVAFYKALGILYGTLGYICLSYAVDLAIQKAYNL